MLPLPAAPSGLRVGPDLLRADGGTEGSNPPPSSGESCANLKTTSTFWCRVPPRFKAYLEADRAEEAQRLLSARRPGASGVPCRGARLGAVSEHAYSAVAEYVSFDWIRKEIPVRLDGDRAHYLEGFRRADLE